MRIRIIPAFQLICGLALVGCHPAVHPTSPAGAAPAVGALAPEIEGQDWDGAHFKLSDYRGKVVVLDFWEYDCEYCQAMFPDEQALLQRRRDQPFALLGIDIDRDKERPKQLAEKKEITWPNWWDRNGKIGRRWDIEGLPTIYILDAQGVIRFYHLGLVEVETLDQEIDQLLKEMDGPKSS